jgi:hypothetical protein
MSNWKTEIKKWHDEFIYVTNLEEVNELAKNLKTPSELALDSETYVLPKWKGTVPEATDPFTCRVSLLAIASRSSLPYVIDFRTLKEKEEFEQAKRILLDFLQKKERLLAYNAKFDQKMLRAEGIFLTNFWCVRVPVKLLTNALGSKFARRCGSSLSDVLRDYLDINLEGKGAEQVSDWFSRPERELTKSWLSKVRYAANDIRYLFDIDDLIVPALTKPLPWTVKLSYGERDLSDEDKGLNMERVLYLEQESQIAVAEMEWNGLPIAPEATERFYNSLRHPTSLEGELNRLGGQICERLGLEAQLEGPFPDVNYRIPRSHTTLRNPTFLRDVITKQTGLKLDNFQKSQLNRLLDLFAEAEQVQSGEKEDIEWANEQEAECYSEIKHIERSHIREYTELIDLIIRYKHLDKVYGMDLRQFINPVTGRVHANYDSCGASTSRTSSSKPNAQQINGRVEVFVKLLKDNPLDQPRQ